MTADEIINLADKLNRALEGSEITINAEKVVISLADLNDLAKFQDIDVYPPSENLPYYWANLWLGKVQFELQTTNFKLIG